MFMVSFQDPEIWDYLAIFMKQSLRKPALWSPYVGKKETALDKFLKNPELPKDQNPSGYLHLSWLTILLTKTFLIILLSSNISTWKLFRRLVTTLPKHCGISQYISLIKKKTHCKNKAFEQISFYSFFNAVFHWCIITLEILYSFPLFSLLCIGFSITQFGTALVNQQCTRYSKYKVTDGGTLQKTERDCETTEQMCSTAVNWIRICQMNMI